MRDYFMYENKRRNKFWIEYPKLFATDRHCNGVSADGKDKLNFQSPIEHYIIIPDEVTEIHFCDFWVKQSELKAHFFRSVFRLKIGFHFNQIG